MVTMAVGTASTGQVTECQDLCLVGALGTQTWMAGWAVNNKVRGTQKGYVVDSGQIPAGWASWQMEVPLLCSQSWDDVHTLSSLRISI